MGRYVVRRLLQFIPTLAGSMFILHYLTCLGIQFTGDPVRALFGEKAPTPVQLEQMRRSLNLDDPCLTQKGNPCLGSFEDWTTWRNPGGLFWDRFTGFFTLDFGTDLRQHPVTDLVLTALPYTLKLALIAFVVDIVIGVSAGVLAGLRSGGAIDYAVKIGTVLTISVPSFILYLAIQTFLLAKFGNVLRDANWPEWITQGIMTPSFKSDYEWLSLIVPGVLLGSFLVATTARLTRTSMLENLRADYVRTARAKGLTRKRVIGVHTLRNSLIPVVTNLGLDIGGLMVGAVVAESVFNIPGVGRLVSFAATRGEPMVVIGVTSMLVIVYLLVNLLVDLLYAVLDPRIRYE